MPPLDFRTERERRLRARLAEHARQAMLHATPTDAQHLQALIAATQNGTVPLDDALAAVAELRRNQRLAA